jgi:hypothetical protein
VCGSSLSVFFDYPSAGLAGNRVEAAFRGEVTLETQLGIDTPTVWAGQDGEEIFQVWSMFRKSLGIGRDRVIGVAALALDKIETLFLP